MAFYETKTVQVDNDPTVIDQVNEQMAEFFWEVKSQQITDRKDSHTEHSSVGDYLYERVITDSANYCTITYQRDKTMPHYNEFVKLESTLNTIRGIMNESVSVEFSPLYKYRWILLYFCFPLGLYLVLTYKSKSKKVKHENAELQKDKADKLAKYPSEDEVLAQIDELRNQIYSELRG